ncbi:MAG TPA: efflux RND transporter periplasmic adaptor subunit [Candidatus Polarisedimenticolia bacterium]|nr:efflux RND transporter periplasmic adaptor subunit [Candidatus Polarisedimenticolia bacterium]
MSERPIRSIPAMLLLVLAAGCGRETIETRPPAADGGAAEAPARVFLAPEAVKKAGIVSEVVHPAPFAETLAVPALLSPTPWTAEEVEARLMYQSATARFRRAATDVERLRRLAGENVVAQKTVQAAESEYSQAQVDRLRSETTLRSLGIDPEHEGSFAPADLWALADIYDSQVPRVKAGVRAFIRVESFPDESFAGRVVSLAAFLKAQTRTLTVRIAVQDPRHRLRPQEPATVEIQVAERTALSVPAPAVLYQETARILFVRRGDAFERVRVRVGAEQGGRAEILAGLADGDEVVTRGAQILLGELFKSSIPVGADAGDEAEER